MLKVRKMTSVIAAVASLGMLAGCSGATQSEPSSSEGTISGNVVVWTLTPSDAEAAAWDAIVAGFEAKYPGVTVVTETRGTDEHKNALRQAAGTSAAPDIYRYWAGSGLGGELVRAGVSRDISDFYSQYGWEQRFTGAAISGVTQYGGFHGVPFVQPGEAIYYNKALFEQAGITKLPATYEELVAVAKQLKAAGITPIEFGGTVNWDVMRLLDSLIETKCGSETADSLTKGDGNWATEACVTEAFTELKTWGDNYILDGFMAMSNEDSESMLFSGKVAMALEGTWFEGVSLDGGMESGSLGLFPFPTGTGRLYGFGENLYITETSQNAVAAAAFLDYFSSPEGQALANGAWARVGVYNDADASQGLSLTPAWVDIFSAATGLYVNNDQNFSTVVTQEYWRVQNLVILGELDPSEAGAVFQAFREDNS
jgi:raffinose/stachyose/melibiose transport system substrate-binding protein